MVFPRAAAMRYETTLGLLLRAMSNMSVVSAQIDVHEYCMLYAQIPHCYCHGRSNRGKRHVNDL